MTDLTLQPDPRYDGLSDSLKWRMRQLGILASDSDFDLSLAIALWTEDDRESAGVSLEALTQAGLVQAVADVVYRVPAAAHALARALLDQDVARDVAFDRYRDWFIAQAAKFNENPSEKWGAFETLLEPHLIEIGDKLAAQFLHDPAPADALNDQVLTFAQATARYLLLRRVSQGAVWLEHGVRAARARMQPAREVPLLYYLGEIYLSAGDPITARTRYEQAVRVCRSLGDKAGEAATLKAIGFLLFRQDKADEALIYVRQAVDLYQRLGDQVNEVAGLATIGSVLRNRGDGEDALPVLQRSLTISESLGDQRGEFNALNNIGMVWADLGQPHKALDYLERALALQFEGPDRAYSESAVLNNLGYAWLLAGGVQKALDLCTQALEISRKMPGDPPRPEILSNLARIADAQRSYPTALNYFEQALAGYRQIGAWQGEGLTLHEMGVVWWKRGVPRKAILLSEQGLAIFQAHGNLRKEAALRETLAEMWMGLDEPQKALDCYTECHRIMTMLGFPGGVARALMGRGGAYARLGNFDEAFHHYKQVLEFARAQHNLLDEANILNTVGALYHKLRRPVAALNSASRALRLCRAAEDEKGERSILRNIGAIWSDLGAYRRTLKYLEASLARCRAAGDLPEQADLHLGIGSAWNKLRQPRKALQHFAEAQSLFRQVEGHSGAATVSFGMAESHLLLGIREQAIRAVAEGLSILKQHDLVHNSMGQSQGDYEQALEMMQSSHKSAYLRFERDYPASAWNVLVRLMGCFLWRGPRRSWKVRVRRR